MKKLILGVLLVAALPALAQSLSIEQKMQKDISSIEKEEGDAFKDKGMLDNCAYFLQTEKSLKVQNDCSEPVFVTLMGKSGFRTIEVKPQKTSLTFPSKKDNEDAKICMDPMDHGGQKMCM